MFRSIRATLLFWYALILLLLLGAFGGTLYYKLRKAIYKEVDGRLRAHAQALAGALETEGGKTFDLELSDDYVRVFHAEDGDALYYVIWDREGKLVDRSQPRLKVPAPDGTSRRSRGDRREVIARGPQGAVVLVGQNIEDEEERLHEFLGTVLSVSGGVMLLALGGGWFLASRALKPVERMSRAAAAVSASNLSERIDVSSTESELGRLAKTLNEAFDRLQAAFERQTRFTADASHELRTPLSIIMSQAELALRKDRTAAEYKEALEAALRASRRMKGVVDGLLTLARADAKEINLRKDRVDLRAVVEETVSMLGPLALERKVSLTGSAERAEVWGDADRLREGVTNLVSNAVRYNREGGRVDVALECEEGWAVLTVSDTGMGIPEKDQPRIFERFFRVDKARSREAGGTGLGLAITKWVVEAQGGVISFASKEGEGTTFTVRLPRCSS